MKDTIEDLLRASRIKELIPNFLTKTSSTSLLPVNNSAQIHKSPLTSLALSIKYSPTIIGVEWQLSSLNPSNNLAMD